MGYAYSHCIEAVIAPASDEYSIAAYGERSQSMYTLTVPVDTDVRCGDVVTIDAEGCRIISDLKYTNHRVLTAERAGKVWTLKSAT